MSKQKKCMFCDKPATIHLIPKFVNQKKREVHLCEGCAREHNLLPDPPAPPIDLKALMNLLMPPIPAQSRAGLPSAIEPSCPECGLTYAAFKAEGRLGCAHDYEAFRPVLEPLLERVHRGIVHAGKLPVNARRAAMIEDLRAKMKAAVAIEDYEQAARLRDLVHQQEAEGTPG
jgi:protein arginine kinase activator